MDEVWGCYGKGTEARIIVQALERVHLLYLLVFVFQTVVLVAVAQNP